VVQETLSNAMKAKIVYCGHHNAGVKSLKTLYSLGFEIALVIAHRPYRKERVWYQSVYEKAKKLNLDTIYYEDISTEDLLLKLSNISPKILLCVSFRKLIPQTILDHFKNGAFNLHDSLLPKNRGFTPSTWVIINGETQTGVTLHLMEAEADTGDIVGQKAVDISDRETGRSLNDKLASASSDLVEELAETLLDGTFASKPQNHSLATYNGPRGRKETDDQIDWKLPARAIDRLIRASSHPIAGTYASFNNDPYFIWKSYPIPPPNQTAIPFPPGTILDHHPSKGMEIATGEGSLWISSLQSRKRSFQPIFPNEKDFPIGERWT